jgi:hypothetical protein
VEKINHFYHIYSDGRWQEPVDEHILAMKSSGLLEKLSGFHVGLVGKKENRELVKQHLLENKISFNVIDEQEEAWEQMTMNKLHDFVQFNDGLILYAHTKGAFNYTPINISWRKSMCYYNVVKWEDATKNFDDAEVDTVGCHWCHNAFWGGTYWWARAEYLRKLSLPLTDNRWRAEEWIGSGSPKIVDMNPGWPDFKRFITSW